MRRPSYRMDLVTHIEIFDFNMCAKARVNVRRLRLLTLPLTPAKAAPLTRLPKIQYRRFNIQYPCNWSAEWFFKR